MNFCTPKFESLPECLPAEGTNGGCRCAMIAVCIITIISLIIVTSYQADEGEFGELSTLYTPIISETESPADSSVTTYLSPTTSPPPTTYTLSYSSSTESFTSPTKTSYPSTGFAAGEPIHTPIAYPSTRYPPNNKTRTAKSPPKSPTAKSPPKSPIAKSPPKSPTAKSPSGTAGETKTSEGEETAEETEEEEL